MKIGNLFGFVLVLIVYGCAQHPTVMVEQQPQQRKLLASKHWGTLADRITDQLILDRGNVETRLASVNTTRYYVPDLAPDMAFGRAFSNYLKQSLMRKGLLVVKSPENAVVLNYRVERFLYDRHHDTRYPFNTATFWTTLGALGWAIADNSLSNTESRAAILVAGPVVDYLNIIGDRTNAEVIISAFIEDNDQVVFMFAEEFYVQPTDLKLYWTDFPPGSIRPTTAQSALGGMERNFPVVK